jgi:hypothetical protein
MPDTVYVRNHKGEQFKMVHIDDGMLYSKYTADDKYTGDKVNLPLALQCRMYMTEETYLNNPRK